MNDNRNNNYKILQWNARSLVRNKASLEHFFTRNSIAAAAISETWFHPNRNYSLKGYDIIRHDRHDGRAGAALLIRTNIQYELINIPVHLNGVFLVAAKIKFTQNNHITLVSIYNEPRNNISKTQWESLFNSLTSPTIIAGDLNCHHVAVGSSYTDRYGVNLFDAMNDCSLTYLNDGSPTLLPSSNQTINSAVDITLASQSLATRLNWELLDDTLGSNHWPVIITLDEMEEQTPITPTRKWNLRKADWDKFVKYWHSQESRLINCTYEDFITILEEACEASIPRTAARQRKPRKHWWNNRCQQAVDNRQKACKKYKRISNWSNFIEVQRFSAISKQVLSYEQRESFKSYCNQLNRSTPIQQIWLQIKAIKGSQTKSNSNCIHEGPWINDFFEKLAPTDANQHTSESIKPDFVSDGHFDTPFTMKELDNALRNSDSAPGMDNIPYKVLYHLPITAKRKLLELFNLFWQTESFPST